MTSPVDACKIVALEQAVRVRLHGEGKMKTESDQDTIHRATLFDQFLRAGGMEPKAASATTVADLTVRSC